MDSLMSEHKKQAKAFEEARKNFEATERMFDEMATALSKTEKSLGTAEKALDRAFERNEKMYEQEDKQFEKELRAFKQEEKIFAKAIERRQTARIAQGGCERYFKKQQDDFEKHREAVEKISGQEDRDDFENRLRVLNHEKRNLAKALEQRETARKDERNRERDFKKQREDFEQLLKAFGKRWGARARE